MNNGTAVRRSRKKAWGEELLIGNEDGFLFPGSKLGAGDHIW